MRIIPLITIPTAEVPRGPPVRGTIGRVRRCLPDGDGSLSDPLPSVRGGHKEAAGSAAAETARSAVMDPVAEMNGVSAGRVNRGVGVVNGSRYS